MLCLEHDSCIFLLPHTTALAAARDRLATWTGWQEMLTKVLHHETYRLRFLRTRRIYCHGRPQVSLELSRLPRAGATTGWIAAAQAVIRGSKHVVQSVARFWHLCLRGGKSRCYMYT